MAGDMCGLTKSHGRIGAILGLLAFAYYVGFAIYYGPTLDSDDYGFILSGHRAIATGEFVTTIDLKPLHVFLGMLLYPFPAIAFEIVVAAAAGLLIYFVWCWTAREAGVEAAALAAGWVWANPSLLFLVLSGNTVTTFTAFVMGALYYATARPIPSARQAVAASLLLALAGTTRVEAWFLTVPLLAYWLMHARGGRRWLLACIGLLTLLGPAIWFLFGWLAAGDPLHYYGTNLAYAKHAQAAAKSAGQYVAWLGRQVYLMVSTPIPLLAVLGLAVKRRLISQAHPAITFPALIVLIFGCASTRGFALQFRFVFFPVLALTIFAAIGAAGALTSAIGSKGRRRWTLVVGFGILVGICAYATDPKLTALPSGSYKAWTYYFDKEARIQRVTRQVGETLRGMCGEQAATVLVPARRLAQIRLAMRPRSSHRFVTYRQLIADGRTIADAKVRWIVYLPSDFLNADHARRFRFLESRKEAKEAGVLVQESVQVSGEAAVMKVVVDDKAS